MDVKVDVTPPPATCRPNFESVSRNPYYVTWIYVGYISFLDFVKSPNLRSHFNSNWSHIWVTVPTCIITDNSVDE